MLENLGNLGEFIGSIAVLASLLYLALQVRQATKWQRHAAALDRATALTSPFFASSELPAVNAKIMAVDGLHPMTKAFRRAIRPYARRSHALVATPSTYLDGD